MNWVSRRCNFADRNECDEWGYCDQGCKNNNGGFECSCASGYVQLGGVCRASPSKPKMKLYFTHYNSIMYADPYGTVGNNVFEVTNATGAVGLDYYSQKSDEWLFYTDVVKNKVVRTSLTPGKPKTTLDFR